MVQPNAVARFDTANVVALMTETEARQIEAEIIKIGDRLRTLLVEFYERQGYRPLGYSSYTAWAEAIAPRVFGVTRARLTQELTAAVIERELETIVTNSNPIPETHLRPMSVFVDRPRGPGADAKPIEVNGEAIRGAWQEANARTNGKPTARIVEQVVTEMRDDVLDPPMESAQAVDVEIAQGMRRKRPITPHFTSNTPEWYTPDRIIALVERAFGQIDLDPCSNSSDPTEANVPAASYWTQADDGLAQPWHGRVYMNPPYGDVIGAWVDRMVRAYATMEINEAIALLPARIDTAWFQPLFDFPICWVRGRLRFSNAENSAPFPSVIVYLGDDIPVFHDIFADIGPITPPTRLITALTAPAQRSARAFSSEQRDRLTRFSKDAMISQTTFKQSLDHIEALLGLETPV